MTKPTLDDIQKLLHEVILPFYQIKRDMPLPFKRNENDAEHSWALALLAGVLAPIVDSSLDLGKVCQFAVIHDVVEVYAGDTSVWAHDTQLANKAKREKEAIKKIEQEFVAFPWLAETINEYEKKDTDEALFIYALDKFLNLLVVYTDKGQKYRKRKITKERFDEMTVMHRQKAHSHHGIKDYYDELLRLHKSHPEYFYQEQL